MNDNSLKHRGMLRLLFLAAALIAVCVVVSLLTARWVMRDTEWRHDQPHGHDWLQQELGLDASEIARINAFEGDYRSARAELLKEFNARINELAELLRTTDSYSDEVTHSIHRLHEVHGRIQELSIEHYYDMLSVLPPDKQKALRDLAVNALSTPE